MNLAILIGTAIMILAVNFQIKKMLDIMLDLLFEEKEGKL